MGLPTSSPAPGALAECLPSTTPSTTNTPLTTNPHRCELTLAMTIYTPSAHERAMSEHSRFSSLADNCLTTLNASPDTTTRVHAVHLAVTSYTLYFSRRRDHVRHNKEGHRSLVLHRIDQINRRGIMVSKELTLHSCMPSTVSVHFPQYLQYWFDMLTTQYSSFALVAF